MKELNTSMTVKKNIKIPVILFNYCYLPLKRYSIPPSLFPTSLHSILPNLLSVNDLLLVKMEVISCEISYLLPFFFHPCHSSSQNFCSHLCLWSWFRSLDGASHPFMQMSPYPLSVKSDITCFTKVSVIIQYELRVYS